MNKEEIINELKYWLNFEAIQINKIEVINIINLIKDIEQQNQKYKEIIDKAIKCIDYNTKYRNVADVYQFVDIESEILEPLKYILEQDEENGNAYLKEFNDWLKEVE